MKDILAMNKNKAEWQCCFRESSPGKLLCLGHLFSRICPLRWDDSNTRPRWACGPEHPHGVPACGLGFLAAWQLGSKRECFGRELSKRPVQGCKIAVGYRKVITASPDSRKRETRLSLLRGEWQRPGEISVCGHLGKYHLLRVRM